MLINPQISILDLTKLIGLLSSTVQAGLLARLQYRYPQELQVERMRRENSFLSQVNMVPLVKPGLLWWIENLWLCNGRSIKQPKPQLETQTDASLKGSGAHCNGILTWVIVISEGVKLSHKHSGTLSIQKLRFLRLRKAIRQFQYIFKWITKLRYLV